MERDYLFQKLNEKIRLTLVVLELAILNMKDIIACSRLGAWSTEERHGHPGPQITIKWIFLRLINLDSPTKLPHVDDTIWYQNLWDRGCKRYGLRLIRAEEAKRQRGGQEAKPTKGRPGVVYKIIQLKNTIITKKLCVIPPDNILWRLQQVWVRGKWLLTC